jgi:hypothetical protein
MDNNVRKPSHRLTFEEAVEVQIRILRGELHSRIAPDYDVNAGRISEVKTGKIHHGSYEEALRRLDKAA